jgi:hypothetical protein
VDALSIDGGEAKDLSRKQLETLCKMGKAKAGDSACGSEGVVGSCRGKLEFGRDKGDRAFRFVRHYHSSGPKKYSRDTAKAHCENSKGEWLGP